MMRAALVMEQRRLIAGFSLRHGDREPSNRHGRIQRHPFLSLVALVGTPVAGTERARSDLVIVTLWRSPRAVVVKGREQGGLVSWRAFYVMVI